MFHVNIQGDRIIFLCISRVIFNFISFIKNIYNSFILPIHKKNYLRIRRNILKIFINTLLLKNFDIY